MKVKVPDRYNYVAVFLTLRCNLSCDYCINRHGTFKAREEIDAPAWIEAINRLELPDGLTITLEGGEPTVYPGFYEVVRNLNRPVDLLTNLAFDVDAFADQLDPRYFNHGKVPGYKAIRASYHQQPADNLAWRAARLQDAGYSVGIFSVAEPNKIAWNMAMAEVARKHGVYFFTKDFLGMSGGQLYGHYRYPGAVMGQKKKVKCRSRELLVAPDGQVFRCHRDLYAGQNSIGSLLDPQFQIKDVFRICHNFGDCNPCDIKEKTNRMLEMGNCAVEIIDEAIDVLPDQKSS